MREGAKVICVNDTFEARVHALYKQLPKKDDTYTVRSVSLGREKLTVEDAQGNLIKGGASDHVTVRILLDELRNDPDPTQLEQYRQELGFNAERFRELEEKHSEEYTEEYMLNSNAVERELVPAN